MKTRLPEVNPILRVCGDGSALACIPIRTAVGRIVAMIEIDLHRVRVRLHDAARAPPREAQPGLHSTEDMSSSRRRSTGRSRKLVFAALPIDLPGCEDPRATR